MEPENNETTELEPVVVEAPWLDRERKTAMIESLRRGDIEGILGAFGMDRSTAAPQVVHMAELLVEWRRNNIATIGAHDVFFRRSPAGDLLQVVAPVHLSVEDGTLYRMPTKHEARLKEDPSQKAGRYTKKADKVFVPVYDDPLECRLTAAGYNRLNEVAGCSVGMPDTVAVDGRREGNPYVVRNDDNDLRRIVLQVNVAGPSPLTGNIIVVQYILDLDVLADLQHMLMNVIKGQAWKNKDAIDNGELDADTAEGISGAVRLMPRAMFPTFQKEHTGQGFWHWIPLYGGVGLAHNLSHPEVRMAYDKYVSLVENAYRKAQTIARRNAMRLHPALARQMVRARSENNLSTQVRAIGWSMAGADMARYAMALDKLARGEVVEGIEVVEHTHSYDPEADNEVPLTVPAEVVEETEEEELDDDTAARNLVRAQLDELCLDLTGRAIRTIGYPPPPEADLADLESMLAAAKQQI